MHELIQLRDLLTSKLPVEELLSREEILTLTSSFMQCSVNRPKKTFKGFTYRFGGTRERCVLLRFIRNLKNYKDAEQMTDEDAIEDFASVLIGPVREWWYSIKSGVTTWKKAISELRDKFYPITPNHDLFHKMLNGKQDDHTTLRHFVTLKMSLLDEISFEDIEKLKVDIVYGLLNEHDKRRIPREAVHKLEDLKNWDNEENCAERVKTGFFNKYLNDSVLVTEPVSANVVDTKKKKKRNRRKPKCRKFDNSVNNKVNTNIPSIVCDGCKKTGTLVLKTCK